VTQEALQRSGIDATVPRLHKYLQSVKRTISTRAQATNLILRPACATQSNQLRMSPLGLGCFKTFRQKRFKLRETVDEPFFEFDYARIAAISG